MKYPLRLSIVFLFAVFATPLWAVDYQADTTFNPVFELYDEVTDVVVQPDGKLVVGGALVPFSGNPTFFLRRLNLNGTIDTTFNPAISGATQGSSYVSHVTQLFGGGFLVTGSFTVAGQPVTYVRLNPDGSVDPSMATANLGTGATIIKRTIDQKFIACTPRTINGQLYKIAHRINADGTPDPTFRVTFMDGYCSDVMPLNTGKVLIVVGTQTGQTPVKPLHRLNSDGSKDVSFDANLPVGSYAEGLTVLPDGKVLVSSFEQGQNTQHARRLLPDGSLDITIPLCAGSDFLPLADGSLITNQCKRWTGYFGNRLDFARVYADGSVNQKLDAIYFDYGGVTGFRNAGNEKYYVFGGFRGTQSDTNRRKLVRLEPNLAPTKAKFDFDNDGRSDLAVFRPSDRTWYIKQSTAGFTYMPWGLSTDQPAAGHYDNDGKTDIAIFRDGILHAYSPAFGHRQLFIGASGDKPLLGNFEDSGTDIEDFAVRGVRSGAVKWFIREGGSVGNPVGGASSITVSGELASDKPVVGDFNGDSRDELGYFRDGLWYTVDRYNYAPPATFQFGSAGDIPVPGDYDGDRQTDYAIFRPSNGEWWINRSTLGLIAIRFGQNGDIPVPADYDGDGKVDIAIFRNGVWWQYLIGTGTVRVEQWGSPGDKPIPAQNQ